MDSGRPETFLVLGVLAFTTTCFVISMYCCADWANWRMNRRRAARPNTHQPEQFLPSASKGLDHSQIQSIPVCFYRATDDAIQGSDCAICLGKFGDGEQLRLLPKCGHAFHVPCIDTWLQLNSNCPLCRSQILENGENGDAVVILPHVSAAPERLQDFCPQFTEINQDQAALPVFSPEFSLPRRSTVDHLILNHKLFRYKSMPCPRATSASNGPASLAADLV